jgi:hypothetical protein
MSGWLQVARAVDLVAAGRGRDVPTRARAGTQGETLR